MNEKKLPKLWITVIVLCALGAIAPILHLEHGTLAITHLIAPVQFAFFGAMVVLGRYTRQNIGGWLGLAMVGWYYISRVLLGEPLLDESYPCFCGIVLAYLVALPFAYGTKDIRKQGLIAIAACYTLIMGVLGWIGFYASFVKRIVTIPYLNTHIHQSVYGQLWLNTNPNASGCILLIGFMLAVWLLIRTRSKLLHTGCIAAAVGMYLGITLTASRTVMVQFSCFMGAILALCLLRLPIKSSWKRLLIAVPAALLCTVLVFFSFRWTVDAINAMHAVAEETAVVVQRKWNDATLTGRTAIYRRSIDLLIRQPRILLLGVLDGNLGEVFQLELQKNHTHNAFLQTAINYGLPALLLSIVLTFLAVRDGLRLIFHRKAAFEEQVLAVIPLIMLLGSITEPYLFTNNTTICNFTFMLVLGYVVEASRRLKNR